MALLLDEERFLKIKQAMEEEHNQPEVLQELLLKLISDLQILKGIQQEKKKPTTQTGIVRFSTLMKTMMSMLLYGEGLKPPDEPIKEPDNSLSMGDKHLSTIPETESDEVIKSRCENHLSPNPKILSNSIDDDTSSDDDDFEDVEYVSLEEVNDGKEFDLEDILQIQDVILREKLLNIHRLISNIESLKVNPTPDRVLKSPSPFPIPVADSDSFLEESDTSLSHLDNSLPEFESCSDHTEETRSGSTTLMLIITLFRVRTIPSHLPSVLFSHLSPTPRPLFYLAPPGVKIRSLTPSSPLRAGGISSDYPDFEDSCAHALVWGGSIDLIIPAAVVLTCAGIVISEITRKSSKTSKHGQPSNERAQENAKDSKHEARKKSSFSTTMGRQKSTHRRQIPKVLAFQSPYLQIVAQ
ncbi:hypothetical protein Tco_1522396 [Tanacetum coccineum]